ncbi:uncharacterized protein C19orf44 homolog isoform X2 [Betta splendens]|uniref:Uncharacterized protein C19orf44 homolog isoform X2 n=1 Tax=Betta splendens TaxID=158456 RepID=A0A6P7M866_BETSP|nr:uncharacterized protein C19orf44 homolog isoform X2 [Betta splendens]
MWKRGSQSSALNRAQALLVAKKNSRGDGQSTQGSPAETQGTGDGFINIRSAPPNTNTLFSGLSDLSSSISATKHKANSTNYTSPKKNQARLDIGPQSSMGGGGNRFLKKASPPVTNSSQSPVSINHIQQMPEPRCVLSSHHGSQAAVLSTLAQIESRIHSHPQPQEQARKGPQPDHNPIPSLATQQKAVTQTVEATTLLSSAQSSNHQNHKVKRFLKNKVMTSESSEGSGSSAAAATFPLRGIETNSVKVDYVVSLESDEEDMRKLLGDLLDSTDNSFLRPEKSPSITKTEKMLSQTQSTPPSAAVQHLPSNTAALCYPGSPSHHSSSFRFIGQAQACFSPSAVSLSPSPPCVSPLLSRRLSMSRRVDGSQHSICSVSGHSEVLSLEELFPVQPASEDLHNVMSVVSSEDFKLNVMTLDDFVPAPSGFTEKMPGKQRNKHNLSMSESPVRHERRYRKAKQQQHEEEKEDMLDYQSDFESESQREQSYSASQISEQLIGNGDEEVALKVRDEASVSDLFHGRTEDDYSDILSDPSHSCMSQTSDYSDTSESLSRSRDSRSPVSHINQTSYCQSDRHPAARRLVQEAAVQTQPATHTWPTVVSTYNPTVFVLNAMLKHQLATTRQFIESSRRIHTSLVRSLEPPDYRYTTLEETKEYIRMHRPSKLTMKEALNEVMQEMEEKKCTM